MAKPRNRLGGYFLIGALAGFLFFSFQPWLPLASVALLPGLSLKGLIVAFFEAALVGALADWFAVTALFRSPLGLRLPHTNIIARNRDSIAEAVPRFLTGFVTDERLASSLQGVDFASHFLEALEGQLLKEDFHRLLREKVSVFLSSWSGPEGGRQESLRSFVGDLCDFAADNLDPGPSFASLLRWARSEGFDERVISVSSDILRQEIGKNRSRLAAAITPMVKKNAGWKGLFIGQGTLEELLKGVEAELSDISADPRHELKAFLMASIARYADTLDGTLPDPGGEARRLGQGFRDVLGDEGFRTGASNFVADILSRLGKDLGSQDSRFIAGLDRIEDGLVAQVVGDPVLRGSINSGLASLVTGLVIKSRIVEGLAGYLAKVLKGTDPQEFVGRIEDSVWNDLQYIRVNGAVVGGLVGIALTVFSALMPG